jgi:PucR family transcriptional regulator, purine catabolism regulatory protein
MPVTLHHLVADARLGLRVVAGERALRRPVSWVHVSELADPTPFLDGGELLLTTGLGIGPDTDLAGFVGRLAGRGLSGLGFGIGLSHAVVPPGLVTAADAAGLPLLEVPRATPFIAISKGVSAALAAEAYAEAGAADAAQRALTRAALGRDGVTGVLRRLSQLVGGWALLLDPAGAVRYAAPASAAAQVNRLAGEIDRLRSRARLASASFTVGPDHVVVQVLGQPLRAFLAVGRPTPPDRVGRQALGAAAAVLTLSLARAGALDVAQRRLRTGLLRLLLASPGLPAQRTLAGEVAVDVWDRPAPAAPVTVYAFGGPAGARDSAIGLLDGEAAAHPGAAFFADWGDHLVVLAEGAQQWLDRLPERVGGLHAGVSDPMPDGRLHDGLRQARRAADSAAAAHEPFARFADLAGAGLLALLPAERAQAFADSRLAPLLRHDQRRHGDLVRTLTEWLRHHGDWDPTSARLGVHRHTVRNRIRKIADLTGADLDDPGTRAELWFALHLAATPAVDR